MNALVVNNLSIPSVFLEQKEPSMLFQIHGLFSSQHGQIFKEFGIDQLPADKHSIFGDEILIMPNGPGMWLMESETRLPDSTIHELRERFVGTDATVTDLSSARFIVRIRGRLARSLLKKGCPVDIDSMQKNDVVSSLMGHFGATIHCLGDKFDVYVLQSYGQDFWEWCRLSTREFNY